MATRTLRFLSVCRSLLVIVATLSMHPLAAHSQALTVTVDLVLWLRGEDAVDAGGGVVATWPDQSGTSNDATQSIAARRPSIVSGAIGGRDVVRFDGVDDRLDLATNVFESADYPLTVFVVAQTTSGNAHIVGTGSSSSGFLTSFGSGLMMVGDELALKANLSSTGLFLNSSKILSDGQPRILSARARDYQNSTWVNCAFQGSSAAVVNPFAYSKATIGASDGSNSGQSRDPLDGDVAEILVYARALADSERAAVEQYLAARYGVSLCTPSAPDISLNEGLRLFYGLNESGTVQRTDSIAGQHLSPFPADALGISAVTGLVGLAQEIDGPSGYHFFRASSPAMDVSSGSFSWAGWIRLDSFYDSQTLVAKWNLNASAEKEYRVWYNALTSRFEFDVSGTGFEGPGDSITVSHPQLVALDTFYFVEAAYDAVLEAVSLRVSTQAARGPVVSAAWNGGAFFGSADLNVGAHNTCSDAHLDGTVDALGLWGRVLTDDESLALWNGGSGREPTGQTVSVLAQLLPNLGGLCAVGQDPTTENVWTYGCFGTLLHELATDGTLLTSLGRPGESANDVDIDLAPVALDLGGTPLVPGDLLLINGETDNAEIYAVDKSTGSILATLSTSFGNSHVVGGAYHPARASFFLVQDRVLASPTGNRIGEVHPTTGAVLNSFEIPPGYTVNFGDLDVSGATGNLLLVSSDENSIRELTPDGTLVDDHPLPTVIPGLSGIALIGDSGQAWVSTLDSSILRLDGIPCAVPEPGVATGLLIGALQLALLRRRGGRPGHAAEWR